jgi:hypothetical protein
MFAATEAAGRLGVGAGVAQPNFALVATTGRDGDTKKLAFELWFGSACADFRADSGASVADLARSIAAHATT